MSVFGRQPDANQHTNKIICITATAEGALYSDTYLSFGQHGGFVLPSQAKILYMTASSVNSDGNSVPMRGNPNLTIQLVVNKSIQPRALIFDDNVMKQTVQFTPPVSLIEGDCLTLKSAYESPFATFTVVSVFIELSMN